MGKEDADTLRRLSLQDDPRNPGSTAAAIQWLAAEVRELRMALTEDED